MANSKIEVVTGVKNETLEYVDPRSCLEHLGPSFHTTQNAIRIYEWLGSPSALPLLLEKVDGSEGLVLGNMTVEESTYSKSTPMGVQRIILAKPWIDLLVAEDKLNDKLAQEVGATQQPYTFMFRELCSLNLFALAGGYQLPSKSHFRSVQCLDFMVSAIRRSRNVAVYKPYSVMEESKTDSTNNFPMDALISVFTTMGVEGNWLQFEMAVDAIVGDTYQSEVRQLAMAFSAAHGIPIPMHLTVIEGKFFVDTYLNLMRGYRALTPKPANVVNLFQK